MKKTLFIITISLSLSSCLDHLLDPDKPETSQEVINQDGSKQNREDNEQSAPGNSSVSTKNNNSRLEDRTNTEKQNQTEAIQKTVYTDSHNSTKKDTPLYRFTSERLTSVEELSKYSISDLKIMRNEVFARHGYIFIEGSEMHTYFNQMNWYTERRKNVDDYMSNLEKKNIVIIQQAETIVEGINLNYKISVDNLRLRINPDIDSETIENLPENTIVEYLNMKSGFQTAVNIRGRDITSNWYKVKAPSGNLGWIHGCCFEILEK